MGLKKVGANKRINATTEFVGDIKVITPNVENCLLTSSSLQADCSCKLLRVYRLQVGHGPKNLSSATKHFHLSYRCT